MTTVNTFDDILDILDRNPEYQEALRQRVLDEEHRRLPERIDRAVKAVDDLAQTVAEFVQRTNETLANHEARLERVEGQIADLNAATNRVLETVADIQNRLTNVETEMGTMRGEMGDMRDSMIRMEGRMDSMQGQLNNLTGTDYERRIVRRSRGLVERQLGIGQARLLQAVTVPDNTTVPDLLRNAVMGGLISGEQEEDVDEADLILFGNTSDGSESYVVAEVSITIDDHDVDRAHRRAAALNAASRVPAKAAVIGAQISDANRQRAESLNVGVVIAAPRVRG